MSVENIAALKRQRATIKASCTRTKTYVDAVTSLTPSVIAQLEERKVKLDLNWSEYNTVQSRIEALDENEGSDRSGFKEAYYALSAKMRKLTISVPSARNMAPSPSNVSDTYSSVAHVRLPKLNLSSFSGKYDEWFPFF